MTEIKLTVVTDGVEAEISETVDTAETLLETMKYAEIVFKKFVKRIPTSDK